MDLDRTLVWLFEHGGPVIRHRIATEYSDAVASADLEAKRFVQGAIGCALDEPPETI